MHLIHLAVVAALLSSGAAVAAAQGKDFEERRERLDRLEAEIREMEDALKQKDTPAERRDEIKKRLGEKYALLRELRGDGHGKGPRPELVEKLRGVEMRIHELEAALKNKELGPEDRKELTDQLHRARANADELRAHMKGDPLHRKDITGKVTATADEHGLMVLSLGRDNGVNEGDEFTVHRESMFIAKLVIDRVDRNWSSGRVTLKGKDAPRVGDVATRNQLQRPHQDPRVGPPFDPESHKLHAAAQELEQHAHGIASKLRKTPAEDAKAREELKGLLVKTVTELFDLREKARAREVELIKKRLEELTQMLEKRKANRDAIIEKRVKQLSGESDELDW